MIIVCLWWRFYNSINGIDLMIDKSKKNSRSGFNSMNATALEAELLNRINKWENIKKEYEQVDLRGAVLVDGHHVFLSIIIEIQNLKKIQNHGWKA